MVMDIVTAGTFFVGSILFTFGFIVIAAGILLLNNIYSRYWKPIEWRIFPQETYHFIEPTVENKDAGQSKSNMR